MILWYKQKSLILDITAEKKLNTVVYKALDADKKWDTAADKKLIAIIDKTGNANKIQDAIASK